MNDEPTQDLSDSEKLDLIIAELSDLRAWRAKVDAFIEDRSRDTKPLLGEIRKEVAEARMEIAEVKEGQARIETRMKHLEQKFEVFTLDIHAGHHGSAHGAACIGQPRHRR